MSIVVWICPECGDYFGSTSAGDLSQKWNQEDVTAGHKGRRTFTRDTCQSCRARGMDAKRVPHEMVPAPVPEANVSA